MYNYAISKLFYIILSMPYVILCGSKNSGILIGKCVRKKNSNAIIKSPAIDKPLIRPLPIDLVIML